DNGPTGSFVWSQVGGGTDADAGQGITVNGDDPTVYVTGYVTNNASNTSKVVFGGTGTSAGTATQLGASGSKSGDLVVAKYTDNGSAAVLDWTQVGGGTSDDRGQGIGVNGSSLYVTGYITNTTANARSVVFGGSGTTAGNASQPGASATSSADIVLVNYTDAGANATLNWTQVGGGTGSDQGQGVGVNGSTIYVVGYVVPRATFGSFSVDNPTGSTVNFLGQLSAATPLPVVLTAFTATPAAGGRAVRLEWATASETTSARFEAERSIDGVSFAAFRTVAAAGSSPAPHTYALTDAILPGNVQQLYYRLRQVDVDGTASYSLVRVVVVGLASPLILFPNPAGAVTTLVGAGPGAMVQVFDALGHLAATATADATGMAYLPLPAGLAPGMYVVRAGGQVARLAVQ
ncbi:MAG: T9SS type A sorting domain-containing protein, partial [Hymenobacter sp.]